jgi:DNA helicase-2/ATP-dependent DNA helicase PcrA
VVSNNPDRLGKSLKAEKHQGTNLRYFEARDAHAEAEFVAGELERILADDSDQTCAVEYRTNFQSRSFEEAFRRRGLRYKLVGGFSFYSRAELKDALAYVRVTLHPEDDISLLRVLNVPARGIGKTTVDALRDTASLENLSFWDATESLLTNPASSRATAPLRAFRGIDCSSSEVTPPGKPVSATCSTDSLCRCCASTIFPNITRMENLEELVRAVAKPRRRRNILRFPRRRRSFQRCGRVRRQTRRHLIASHSTKGWNLTTCFHVSLEDGIAPAVRNEARVSRKSAASFM